MYALSDSFEKPKLILQLVSVVVSLSRVLYGPRLPSLNFRLERSLTGMYVRSFPLQ